MRLESPETCSLPNVGHSSVYAEMSARQKLCTHSTIGAISSPESKELADTGGYSAEEEDAGVVGSDRGGWGLATELSIFAGFKGLLVTFCKSFICAEKIFQSDHYYGYKVIYSIITSTKNENVKCKC